MRIIRATVARTHDSAAPALRKNIVKAIASVAAAAALVVAPLAAAGASAAEPLVGKVGVIEDATPKANSEAYWEARYAAFGADCYKHNPGDSTEHGSVTDDGKTVTLAEFQDSWPGDAWVVLIVKGATSNNVIESPEAGVAYASPTTNGDTQSAVSHWIVCKGTVPTTTPTTVVPTLDVNCDLAGYLAFSSNVNWSSVKNADETVTWTAVPKPGTAFAPGTQDTWTVPALAQLVKDCTAPEPQTSSSDETVFDCGDSTATVTTTTVTTPYVWSAVEKKWVLGTPTSAQSVVTRALTALEKSTCPPDTKVEYGAWEDGEWACGDTTVTQTREVSTTVYGVDEQGQPTAKSSVAIETRIRDLEQSEIAECPLVPGEIFSACVGDVPYLSYDVTLPEGYIAPSEKPVTITFVNPDGEDYVVANQPLKGKLLWPGASAEEPKMWPGWALVAGKYVKTEGNFNWTRVGITVLFQVNPSYETSVSYPEATALCASPASTTTDDPSDPTDPTDPGSLAVTGGVFQAGAVAAGAIALLAGVAMTVVSTRRRKVS